MSWPISQFYPLLLVLWGVAFWCRSRVFRFALLISLAFHSIFFVRVSGWGRKVVEPERIISFTFVQGAEEAEKPSPRDKTALPRGLPAALQQTPPGSSDHGREEASGADESAPKPLSRRVETGLPRIDDESLLEVSPHPLAEDYRRELQRLIERYQKTPPEILEQGLEARVKVWFNLSRDGRLNQPVFVDPKIRSSHETVNRAAVDSVVGAADHFPPLPEHINRAEMWFYVYVDFSNVRFRND